MTTFNDKDFLDSLTTLKESNYDYVKNKITEDFKKNIINQCIPDIYRTKRNLDFLHWELDNVMTYSLVGMQNILRWQSQSGSWLDDVVDFLFKIKRNYQGYMLTDHELQMAANFSSITLNLNANSVKAYSDAFLKVFGDIILLYFDTTNKIEYIYIYSNDITMDFLMSLIDYNILPRIIDYQLTIQILNPEHSYTFLRDDYEDITNFNEIDNNIYSYNNITQPSYIYTIYNTRLSYYFDHNGHYYTNIKNIIKQHPIKKKNSLRPIAFDPKTQQNDIILWDDANSPVLTV